MMMIVFVILIYFNGLLVSSEGNYLPFLNPTDYSTHNTTRYTYSYPRLFPIATPVIAPYWDDSDLRVGGEVRYAVITPATNLSLCNQVNDYLSTSTSSSVSVEWILWAYWKDSNHYQVVLAFQSTATYAVFIYKCGLIRWTEFRASVGINSGDGYYINHPSSRANNVTDIDCDGTMSGWSNVIYRLDQGYQTITKFEFLSITSHSITVSWELSIPDINSALILSVSDSRETVNDTIIDVTGYNNYTYNDTKWGCFCRGVYTFKLILAAKYRCNNESRKRSQSPTPHDPIVPVDIPVQTEVNAAYEMKQRRRNQIETSNEIQISQNCSYADATNVDETIYDAIPQLPQEIPPEPDTPHLYDDESAAQYEIPCPTVNQ
uniref:NIDO domain-containing protein n=1 Tax=Amphimedon queenslandica TaxID=400682 RepID=A0A1X7VIN5_AMPQE